MVGCWLALWVRRAGLWVLWVLGLGAAAAAAAAVCVERVGPTSPDSWGRAAGNAAPTINRADPTTTTTTPRRTLSPRSRPKRQSATHSAPRRRTSARSRSDGEDEREVVCHQLACVVWRRFSTQREGAARPRVKEEKTSVGWFFSKSRQRESPFIYTRDAEPSSTHSQII